MNTFLGRLGGSDPVLMLGIRSGRTADVVRIAKSTGHHAVMIDLEHSTMRLDAAGGGTGWRAVDRWPSRAVRGPPV